MAARMVSATTLMLVTSGAYAANGKLAPPSSSPSDLRKYMAKVVAKATDAEKEELHSRLLKSPSDQKTIALIGKLVNRSHHTDTVAAKARKLALESYCFSAREEAACTWAYQEYGGCTACTWSGTSCSTSRCSAYTDEATCCANANNIVAGCWWNGSKCGDNEEEFRASCEAKAEADCSAPDCTWGCGGCKWYKYECKEDATTKKCDCEIDYLKGFGEALEGAVTDITTMMSCKAVSKIMACQLCFNAAGSGCDPQKKAALGSCSSECAAVIDCDDEAKMFIDCDTDAPTPAPTAATAASCVASVQTSCVAPTTTTTTTTVWSCDNMCSQIDGLNKCGDSVCGTDGVASSALGAASSSMAILFVMFFVGASL